MSVLTRGVDADMLAAIAGTWHPVVLIWLDWPDDPVRVHSGAGNIAWGGQAWTGIGDYGQIGYPGEGANMAVERLTLAYVSPTDEMLDRTEDQVRNIDGAIYVGAVTERAGRTLIGEPTEIFAGYMDALRYRLEADDGGSVTDRIELTLASGPSARAVASVFHSYNDQIAKYPGDTAGRHLIEIEKRVGTLAR